MGWRMQNAAKSFKRGDIYFHQPWLFPDSAPERRRPAVAAACRPPGFLAARPELLLL